MRRLTEGAGMKIESGTDCHHHSIDLAEVVGNPDFL
jgi:hypothetical protein